MKLPYRLGDSFALPLGNGKCARGSIVACEHHVVVVRVHLNEASSLDLRVSDDALVLYRWKTDGRGDLRGAAPANPQNEYWMHASRAERIAAAALGVAHPRERTVRVREIRDGNAAAALAELDDDCTLSLTQRVSHATIERIRAAIFEHPGVTVRFNGNAARHIAQFAQTPLTRVSLAGRLEQNAKILSLRHLDLAQGDGIGDVARNFPNAESLRIAGGDCPIRLRDLRALDKLRVLDLSFLHVTHAGEFNALSQLTALRLNRVTGIRTMEPVAELPLRTIAIADLPELQRLDALARVESLEQLEVRGLWQFEIADLQWTLDRDRLVRAEIDIGGRRKNIELYRRSHWAYPWRFH